MQETTKRKPPYLTLLLIVFGVIFTVFSGYIINSIDINPAFKPFAVPALIIVICILCIIALCQYFLQQDPQNVSTKIGEQNRQHLLTKVRNIWIQGFLEHSLHGAVLIALGLQERQDMLTDPWRFKLYQPDEERSLLPPHTCITRIYDEAGGELLILGVPGSGKTTLLLELTRDLIERAEKDVTLPVPLVFNLSSWALKQKSLTDWLVEEMRIKYQVPSKLGQDWIKADQVLPLLDGLDEVSLSDREACVNAINTFRAEHGLSSMVVCSRTGDYELLSAHLQLLRAVEIQPLTDEQVDEYLESTHEHLQAIRTALHDDSSLKELATRPFMLSILSLAYHGREKEVLLNADSTEMRRKQIFREYVNRMIQCDSAEAKFQQEQKINWLSWLAWQLKQHDQSDFYLEQMQPDWLPTGGLRRLYSSIVAGMLCGVGVGLGSVGTFLSIGFVEQALVLGVLLGLLGILMGILSIRPAIVTVTAVLVGAGIGAYYGPHSLQQSLLGGILFGIIMGVMLAIGTLILMSLAKKEIRPAEILVWSFTRVRQQYALILLAMLLGGSIAALTNGIGASRSGGLSQGLSTGLNVFIVTSITIAILSLIGFGFSNRLMEKKKRIKPNQGIWRTAQLSVVWLIPSALLLAAGSLMGKIALFGLDYTLTILTPILVGGILLGLCLGFCFWQEQGGAAFFQHFTLRVLLWRAKSIPWNYISFLDNVARDILLYKLGGGYIFIHRELQDYFASLYSSKDY